MFKVSAQYLAPQVCIDKTGQVCSRDSFLSQVAGTIEYLKTQKERIVLSFEDSQLFAIALCAGLITEKKLLLLPNTKAGTLSEYAGEYDFVLNEEVFKSIRPLDNNQTFEISKDASLILYTSGSQGAAKKVVKRFENLYKEVLELERQFSAEAQRSVFVATVSHQHIYGLLFKVLWPLCTGRTFVAETLHFPEEIEKLASQIESFTLISSPAFLKRYFAYSNPFQNCQIVFSSGGPLAYESAQETNKNFSSDVIEVYGSTETGGIAYRKRKSDQQEWSLLSTVEIEAMDESFFVKSPFFDDAKLMMGDRIQLTSKGFTLLGRVDDVVKIEEKRISLSEINQKILQSKLIRESVVLFLEKNGRQQTGCLAVLSEEGQICLSERGPLAVCNRLRDELTPFFETIVIPRKFRFLSAFPYNEQSKLNKKDLLGYFDDN